MQAYRSPWMTDELEMLRSTARRFFETEVAPRQDKWKSSTTSTATCGEKAGELGLLCISVPEQYGGQGGSFAHEVVVMEEQARVCDTTFRLRAGGIECAVLLPRDRQPRAAPEMDA